VRLLRVLDFARDDPPRAAPRVGSSTKNVVVIRLTSMIPVVSLDYPMIQRCSFRLTTSDDPPGSRRRRRRERRDARDSYGFNGALFAPRSRHRAGARTRESGNNETKRNETKRNETRRFIFSIFTCATHANDSSDADAGHGCERRRRAGVERVL